MSLFDDPDVGVVPEPTFSVGELADAIGNAVRASFRDEVWVRGEIHDLSRPASGHVYLTLVEARPDGSRACLSVMLSAASKVSVNRSLTRAGGAVRMVDGTEVRIRGRLDWYSPRGQLQLRMTAIDPAYTLGQMELARADLLARLDAEGILGRNGTRLIPLVPLRIGLVTSSGTAAEADFVDELERSGLSFSVTAIDVRVQGPGAARSVAAAVGTLARRGCDAIAVVRGGGARTDLAAFDDEAVARAIARSPVPVITGIGHEVDRAVADEVAHTAAKTPTACAQVLVERVLAYLAQTDARWVAIERSASRDLAAHEARLHALGARVARSSRTVLAGASARVDGSAARARRAGAIALRRSQQRLGHDARQVSAAAGVVLVQAEHRLDRDAGRAAGAARAQIREARSVLDHAERRLVARAPRSLTEAARALDAVTSRVRALDPQRALARGWSITRTVDGRVVRSPSDVSPGAALVTQTAGGEVRSTVDGDD